MLELRGCTTKGMEVIQVIPWPLDYDHQLSSMTKTNPLKHKDILHIHKHHKTEPSATGRPLEDKGAMG